MTPTIAYLSLEMRLPGNNSLKGKRGILKSLLARLRHEFNVSVAEVDAHDAWQRAVIGVVCVSASVDYAHGLLQTVAGAVERWRLDCELVDYNIELLT